MLGTEANDKEKSVGKEGEDGFISRQSYGFRFRQHLLKKTIEFSKKESFVSS